MTATGNERTHTGKRSQRQAAKRRILPPRLGKDPTVRELQSYVARVKQARRFKDDKSKTFIRLVAEIGELGAALSRTWPHENTPSAQQQRLIALEIADVLMFLVDLANQYSILLDAAVRDKDKINATRVWREHHRA